jgi:hypothetical protein
VRYIGERGILTEVDHDTIINKTTYDMATSFLDIFPYRAESALRLFRAKEIVLLKHIANIFERQGAWPTINSMITLLRPSLESR